MKNEPLPWRRRHNATCWWRHHDCAYQRLLAIYELHVPDAKGCTACDDPWPCATIQLVRGAES